MSDRLMEFHDAFSEFGDKKDYVNFLQLQLEDSKYGGMLFIEGHFANNS